MNPAKQYYRTYQADDELSELSRELLWYVRLANPLHVLEFGCGTGKNLNGLNQEGVCTLGIDISPMNVYKAIHKYELPCVICGDETYLRHITNVDVVFTCSVLDHIEDVTEIVEELKRVANKYVFLAETNDVPFEGGQFYFPHDYEALGFEKLDYEWKSDGDKCVYSIWKWEKI